MRAVFSVLVLLLVPIEASAYLTSCSYRYFHPFSGGPGTGNATMVISGTTLHFQNLGFFESVGTGAFTQPVAGEPVVSITGNTILVTQTYTPPQTAPAGGAGPALSMDFCQTEDVSVGALSTGTYMLVWRYLTPSGDTDISTSWHVDGTPCNAMPLPRTPRITVDRTATGTAHLHVESISSGYAPVFGAPAVTGIADGTINVEQPFTDSGYVSERPPPSSLCHAEDLDLGVLPAGAYAVRWSYKEMLGGITPVEELAFYGSFVWSGSATLCTSSGLFSTVPTVAANSAPVTLVLSLATMEPWYSFADPVATPDGRQIAVQNEIRIDDVLSPNPSASQMRCFRVATTLPALPTGDYTVRWNVINDDLRLDTYHFSVVQGRRRAAR